MPGVTGGVPRVRDFRDPVALGVRPAWDPGGAPAAPPPYVRRDSHDEVASAVRQSGLVVVEGPSLVGKSRLAFEVMLQSLPDHRLVVPADPAALRELCAGAGTLEAAASADRRAAGAAADPLVHDSPLPARPGRARIAAAGLVRADGRG
jgi:hypothetical protein